jgi:hypothetical protein
MYGVDDRGRVYVHVKVYKQRRVYAEVLVHEGDVKISCRECVRWHRIIFKKDDKAVLEETQAPVEIGIEEAINDSASSARD